MADVSRWLINLLLVCGGGRSDLDRGRQERDSGGHGSRMIGRGTKTVDKASSTLQALSVDRLQAIPHALKAED